MGQSGHHAGSIAVLKKGGWEVVTMNAADIQLLYQYNRWANNRVLDVASTLVPEAFTKDLSSSHRSVQGTLTHIMSAEWIWLMRWNGTSPPAMLDPAGFPTVQSLRTKWSDIAHDLANFVIKITDEFLHTEIAYLNTKGETWQYPLGQMMQHVVNHSSYHRGQVVTMLRQLGAKAVATDFLLFLDWKSDRG
jgi:uncharacterized damage-inducible protein DinB